jgi:hypothetical protein
MGDTYNSAAEAEADRTQQKALLAGAWDRNDETAKRIVRVEVEPISIHGERGQHYRVWLEGAVLIEDTWNPEFETCRAVQARGIRGKLQTWRRGKQHWDMQLDIERGAGLTVEENEQQGPKIVRWRPHPQSAVLSSARRAPAAEWQLAGR